MSIPLRRHTTLALLLLALPALQSAAQEPAGFPLMIGGGYETGIANLAFENMTGYSNFNEGDIDVRMFNLGIGEFSLGRLFHPEIDMVLLSRVAFRSTSAAFSHAWRPRAPAACKP